MNPPPPRPEDNPITPQDGGSPPNPTPPDLPTEPLPSRSAVGRDPLLDDPLFAELVNRRSDQDLPLEPLAGMPREVESHSTPGQAATPPTTATHANAAKLVASSGLPHVEPVHDPDPRSLPEALPVARLADSQTTRESIPTLPATPIRPRAVPIQNSQGTDDDRDQDAQTSWFSRASAERDRSRAYTTNPDHGRPRVLAACGVLGCLSVVLLIACAFVVYAAILILNHLGNQVSRDGTQGRQGVQLPGGYPGPITRTRLMEPTRSLPLGGEVDAIGRGANGRYLLLRIPAQQSLVVFDPNSAELMESIPLGDSNAMFAAGASKLFIYKPKSRNLSRWDLLTKKSELIKTLPPEIPLFDAIAVGAGSNGPLYGVSGTTLHVIDPIELTHQASVSLKVPVAGTWKHMRLSDDGRVIVLINDQQACVIERENGDLFTYRPFLSNTPPKLASPSPDGAYIYTSRGVFKSDGTPILKPAEGGYYFTFPAAHGSMYLSLSLTERDTLSPPLRLHVSDSRLTLARFELTGRGIRFPTGLRPEVVGDIPPNQRVHFWPAAGLVAILATGNQRIDLIKVDVPSLLKATFLTAPVNSYAVIGSDPPRWATAGKEWRYTPEIWIHPMMDIQWVLAEAPEGMRLQGRDLVWANPRESKASTRVRLQAKNPKGFLLAEQVFEITVVDATP